MTELFHPNVPVSGEAGRRQINETAPGGQYEGTGSLISGLMGTRHGL